MLPKPARSGAGDAFDGVARTIRGTCFYGQALGGLMPILDAVGHLLTQSECPLGDGERAALRELLEQQAPELAMLATTNSTTVKVRAGFAAAFGTEESPEVARQQLFDTLFDLLAAASRMQPLVMLLVDVHWADAGTLELLQYLARRAAEIHLLVVATYRPEELAASEVGAGLAQMLAQLNVDGRLEEVSLPRLRPAELLEMARSLFLEADFGDDFAAYLHGQSQGNPFIALEVLKLLHDRQVLHCEAGLWSVRADFAESVIPDRVNPLILQRLEQLSTEHRELDGIAPYPVAPYRAHTGDVTSLMRARNFLYLINPGEYDSRAAFVAALTATDYDLVLVDGVYLDIIDAFEYFEEGGK